MTDTYPTSSDLRDSRRFATPCSAFRRGFEDASYERTFTNPFPKWSEEWKQYCDGFDEAKATRKEWNP